MPRELRTLKGQDVIKAALTSPATFTTVMLSILFDVFGTEALGWDPNTVQMEMEQEFGVDLPAGNFDRLMTGISIITSNSFYTSLPDFARACVVMSGHTVTASLLVLPECDDLAWGITEGMLLSPPEKTEESPFAKEIVAYVGKALDSEGILTPPDVLRIGLRDRDVMDHVRYNFSDDPEMFSGIMQMESSKTDAINHLITARMRALLRQLSTLPLATGNASAVAAKLLAKLPGDEELPLPD